MRQESIKKAGAEIFILFLLVCSIFLLPFYASLVNLTQLNKLPVRICMDMRDSKELKGMALSNLIKDDQPLPQANRLIILVPDLSIDHIALGRRIWDLASVYGSKVVYLSVVKSFDEELRALRKVAALSAVTRDVFIAVESHVQFNNSWQKALQRLVKPGDVAICIDCHVVPVRLFRHKPLGDLLAVKLNLPVYVLSNSATRNIPLGSESLCTEVHSASAH